MSFWFEIELGNFHIGHLQHTGHDAQASAGEDLGQRFNICVKDAGAQL